MRTGGPCLVEFLKGGCEEAWHLCFLRQGKQSSSGCSMIPRLRIVPLLDCTSICLCFYVFLSAPFFRHHVLCASFRDSQRRVPLDHVSHSSVNAIPKSHHCLPSSVCVQANSVSAKNPCHIHAILEFNEAEVLHTSYVCLPQACS